MISESTQNYLKAIYVLQQQHGKVSTNVLADMLGVAPGSVTGMLKKLAEDRPRLVNYERHHGVSLTPAGRRIALEVIRHHRLIELYLQQALGYTWDQVHDEAERLEHVISEDFEDRIAEMLGHPEFDPHGDPIPAKDGRVPERPAPQLSALDAGQSGRVARVRDDDPALLRYLAELGIIPEAVLTVEEKSPFGGTVHVRVGDEPDSPAHALGKEVTDQVFVVVEALEAE